MPKKVKNADGSGGEYPRQYFEADATVPIYFWDRDNDASELIRNGTNYLRKKIIRQFLSQKTFNDIKTAYQNGSMIDPNKPNVRLGSFSPPFFFDQNGKIVDHDISFEPIGKIGLGGATLNPTQSGTQPVISTVIEKITDGTNEMYDIGLEIVLDAFEVEDGWDYNYFKSNIAKITFASVSGSSIQTGFDQSGSTTPYTGQVPREILDISGVHNLIPPNNNALSDVKKFRIRKDNSWSVVVVTEFLGEKEESIGWVLERIPKTFYERLCDAYKLIQ